MSNRTLECAQYEQLIEKRKTKSPVWVHFGLPADSLGKIVQADVAVCKTAISSKAGSTSNLFSHLKLYHPVKFTSVTANSKKNLQMPVFAPRELDWDSPSSNRPLNTELPIGIENHHRHKKQKTMHDFQPLSSSASKTCTLSVTEFLATTMQPYNMVEHKSFIKMLNSLNPRYKLPSRKYFSQSGIPKLYNETVEKIKLMLTGMVNSDISITTDCWTSLAGMPYIAVTSHFIGKDWELKSFCLRCAQFEKDHTSDNIAEVLIKLLADWEIDVKQLASCTTDNAANMLKAIKSLHILHHVPCFGHVINIGVNRALQLPQLNKAVARLKKLQNTVAHSWKMQRDLAKAQELLKMDVVALPSACETRWWSTLKLCERFLGNQLPLCKILQDYPSSRHLMPEGSEVSALEDFVKATKLLKEITTTLSGENYTTASSILPLYRKIKRTLQRKDEDSQIMIKIKSELMVPLSERYEKEPLVSTLRMASLCDPRFRINFSDSADEIKKIAIQHLSNFHSVAEPNENINQENVPAAAKIAKEGLSKLLEEDDDNDTSDETISTTRKAEIELINYLAMPKVNLNTNPLTWWKAHETSFPGLRTLAKKFLAIQGTSVPSERVFSTSGNVITKHRASLLPKNAEMQVFLAQNKHII